MSKYGPIIYIDDDPEECSLFQEVYTEISEELSLSNELKLFYSAADFMQYAEEDIAPALIICDLAMPVLNGIDLRQEVLQNPAVTNTPFVIYSTAEPDPNTLFRLSKLYIDGLYIKSQSYQKMVDTVRTIISHLLNGKSCKTKAGFIE